MQIKGYILIVIFSWFQYCSGQNTPKETTPENDIFLQKSKDFNSVDIFNYINEIYNPSAIANFYSKLNYLELHQNNKLRITHIGDSHIQADFFSGKTRNLFQERFGNAGIGITFPYKLIKNYGNPSVQYTSNTSFEATRVNNTNADKNIGVTGYILKTNTSDFAIELKTKEAKNNFSTVKLITPNNAHLADLAIASKKITLKSSKPKVITHKIKSGDALSTIAQKYKTSVTAIKKANGLKSNMIRVGKTLKIPTNQKENVALTRKEFIPLDIMQEGNSFSYYSTTSMDKIYIIPTKNASNFELNGIILENDLAGIIYNSIGVNGAKALDFNKFPLFFEQLEVLNSDLIIISLGTNESFDKIDTEAFFSHFKQMLSKIRYNNPLAEILVTTPPPSLWKQKFPNTLVESYTQKILESANIYDYAVWNLYGAMGGLQNITLNTANNIIAKDKVHYTKEGYESQGELFYQALLNSYLAQQQND